MATVATGATKVGGGGGGSGPRDKPELAGRLSVDTNGYDRLFARDDRDI